MKIYNNKSFNAKEILLFLTSFYKDRITKGEINPNADEIKALFDKVPFVIRHIKDSHLLIMETRDIEVLGEVFSSIMSAFDKDDLCHYAINNDKGEKSYLAEWSGHPFERAKQIMDNKTFYDELVIKERYLPKKYQLVKIPGIYMGMVDRFINMNKPEEIYFFLAIMEHLGKLDKYTRNAPNSIDLKRMNTVYRHDEIEKYLTLFYLIVGTAQFGVSTSPLAINVGFETTQDFQLWFKKWEENALAFITTEALSNLLYNYYHKLPLNPELSAIFKKLSQTGIPQVSIDNSLLPNNISYLSDYQRS